MKPKLIEFDYSGGAGNNPHPHVVILQDNAKLIGGFCLDYSEFSFEEVLAVTKDCETFEEGYLSMLKVFGRENLSYRIYSKNNISNQKVTFLRRAHG